MLSRIGKGKKEGRKGGQRSKRGELVGEKPRRSVGPFGRELGKGQGNKRK